MALGPAAVGLTWLGLAAFVTHAGLVVVPLVRLAGADFVTGGPPQRSDPATSRLDLLTVEDLLAASAVSTSILWLLLGLALVAAGLALRAGTHRAAIQAAAVATLPAGGLAIAELAWLQPCSLPGAAIGAALHLCLAVLGGWLALQLARPAGRNAFARDEA